MLKTAFNMLTRIHSRAATMRRPGNPDIFSPVRITPSNYFRFIEGPSEMVIHGREFILPTDTLLGQWTQKITFSKVPTVGSFVLYYGLEDTDSIAFSATAADIQTELREIPGLANVTVTGSFSSGFVVTFVGVSSPALLEAVNNTLGATITIAEGPYQAWTQKVKRGDRIQDEVYGEMTVDEIVEIVDIGGSIMGFRCRVE